MSWAGVEEAPPRPDLSPCSAVGKNIWIHWYHGTCLLSQPTPPCICLGVSEMFEIEVLAFAGQVRSFFWKMVRF